MTGLVAASIEKKTITWFLAFLILVSGIISFGQLGRLEDPDFTVKVGLIVTQYPGADPPPLNWSILIVRSMEEDHYGEEDLQARRDRREAAPG